MATTETPNNLTNDLDLEMAGRIGRSWREIRRGATQSTLRDVIYGVGGSAIEPGQMDALDLLVTVESCRMGDLADYLHIDPSTATRAVQRLIKDNLAERVKHGGDGRVVTIAATDRGRRIHGEVAERRRSVLLDVMSEFTESERFALAEYLERFQSAMDNVVERRSRRYR